MGSGGYMDGCGTFMKYTLFFLNLITFLGGIAVVGLGIWIIVDKSFATAFLGTNMYTGAIYILIGTGALVTFISCFGCFGAAKEVRCLLVTYFIIVFLIFVTMLVGGILGYVFRTKVENSVRQGMEKSVEKYSSDSVIREAWNQMQIEFKCCGVDGPESWGSNIPDSCCKPVPIVGATPRCSKTYSNVRNNGCFTEWTDSVKQNAALIGGVGIGVAAIMLIAMIFSCALINMID